MAYDKEKAREKRQENVQKATELIEQGIKSLMDSDSYKDYLTVLSKFHTYSFNNTMLINMQNPDARLVKGFNSWKNEFDRYVKKGEKGIQIFAPLIANKDGERPFYNNATGEYMKDEKGNTITKEYKKGDVIGFRTTSVFDISQTDGEPIKELKYLSLDELNGDVSNFDNIVKTLEKYSSTPISFENIDNGAKGYYNLIEKRIVIKDDMSELHKLKTAIHETTHAKLHDIDITKNKLSPDEIERFGTAEQREVVAESVAFVVCNNLGIDTSDYSFKYIAGWSSGSEAEELKEQLELIRKTAHEMIESIEKELIPLLEQDELIEQEQEFDISQEISM